MPGPIGADVLGTLVFSWMVALSPPERDAPRVFYPEAVETVDERRERYEEIARDVGEVAAGLESGRRGAAELLVAVAWHESGFRKDVDLGPCAAAWVKAGGCDSGSSRTMWQLKPWDSWDRRDSAREALRRAFASMRACKASLPEDRLALYAGGGACSSHMGRQRSREIWQVVRRIKGLRDPEPLG